MNVTLVVIVAILFALWVVECIDRERQRRLEVKRDAALMFEELLAELEDEA